MEWKRDGIDGEVAVNVSIGGETSVTVAAVDNKPLSALTDAVSAPGHSSGCRTLRLFDDLIKALQNTSNSHENGGTVEYFAGQ